MCNKFCFFLIIFYSFLAEAHFNQDYRTLEITNNSNLSVIVAYKQRVKSSRSRALMEVFFERTIEPGKKENITALVNDEGKVEALLKYGPNQAKKQEFFFPVNCSKFSIEKVRKRKKARLQDI